MLDITTCQGGAPVLITSPHFYNSPDYIRTDFEGITPPDHDLHATVIDVEPNSGLSIQIHKRIQVSNTQPCNT